MIYVIGELTGIVALLVVVILGISLLIGATNLFTRAWDRMRAQRFARDVRPDDFKKGDHK